MKQFFTKGFIVLFLLGQILMPTPAHAQFEVSDLGLQAYFYGRDTTLGWRQALLSGLLGGAMNMVSYFTRKLAYDSAVYLASGDFGQKPLIFTKDWDNYLGDVAGDALASGVQELGQNAFGLDFCNGDLDLGLQVFLQIGIGDLFSITGPGDPQPDCTFNQLKHQWSKENFEQTFGKNTREFIGKTFASSISVDQSDFGVALGGISTLQKYEATAVFSSALERLQGDGFKDVKSYLSGNITTPSELVKQQINSLSPAQQAAYTNQQIAGLYGAQVETIIPQAIQVFAGTFTSQLLDNVISGLFRDKSPSDEANADIAAGDFFSPSGSGSREAAKNAFSFLFAGFANFQLSDYDIVSEFRACPSDNPSLYNCVIDSDFALLLDRAAGGEALTIKQALDEGLLHANWPLINPRNSLNTDSRCFQNAYCYSNLQKLRKVRILPIGPEISALKADPDNPSAWTLGTVVANFETCRFDEVSGRVIPDVTKPYCHLIDPNWVIRAPAVQCRTKGPSEQLLSPNTNERREECIDTPTCVLEADDGSCSSYGYCTKEKNVWDIGADSCPAYYDTCTAYKNTRTGNAASYLARTIDFDACDASTVGCRAYSTEKDANGNWYSRVESQLALKEFGRNQTIHFNERISQYTCSSADQGCTAFYPAQRNPNDFNRFALGIDGLYHRDNDAEFTYLKKAPDYLGCYDINPATTEIDWPQTISDFAFLPQGDACDPYVSACLPSEVGCDAYTPVTSGFGPTVPAIVGNNFCAAECVGYETYRQIGYDSAEVNRQGFEPGIFPLYFIADSPTAEECSAQYVGCDEFTNIDARTQGGESLEYYTDLRYCAQKTDTNEKTYYTWEGSVEDGYVLRTHTVLQVEQDRQQYLSVINPELVGNSGQSERVEDYFALGSPAYADDVKEILEDMYARCNVQSYTNSLNNYPIDQADPDCRAFYDDQAHIFYRLESQLVSVSDSCKPLRKTDSHLAYDGALTNAVSNLPFPQEGQPNLCQQKGGLWADDLSDELPGEPVCQRCVKGGSYINGACVYMALPDESNACPASANNCRLYVGNTSNDVRQLLNQQGDIFEPISDGPQSLLEAKQGWYPQAGLSVVGESVQVGQHSLQIASSQARRTLDLGTVEEDSLYELSFWARGTPQNLSIYFEQVDPIAIQPADHVPCVVDTDNGDNPYQAGLAGSADANIETQLADQCVPGGNNLLEAYCENGIIKHKVYTCGNGCSDGACAVGSAEPLVCNGVDTDGDDVLVDGVAAEDDFFGDQCLGERYLRESYCESDLFVQTLYECAEGCGNDTCNALPLTDVDFNRHPVPLDSFTFDPILNTEEPVSISDRWREYRFGPVQFSGDPEKLISLVIDRIPTDDQSSLLYLDNVRLTRVQDRKYLIKDSWKYNDLDVPTSCDATPNDGLPGAALGCREYTDSANNLMALTGFEQLCRAEAVGCSPVFDTYNTIDGTDQAAMQLFNVFCELPNGDTGPQTCSATVNFETYSCTVIPEERGCYIKGMIPVPNSSYVRFATDGAILTGLSPETLTSPGILSVNQSSVVIPADPAENDPVYMSIRPEVMCDDGAMGCQALGLESQNVNIDEDSSFSYQDILFLNQPDRYLGSEGVLCRDDVIGCSEFSSGATINYFKDPEITGNAICEYKPADQRSTNEAQQFGWFIKNVGMCSNDSALLCTSSNQCGAEDATCDNVGNVPCYGDFLQRGGEFGLWSNNSSLYDGYVGSCEPQYNGCVELVDHADTDNGTNLAGTSYHVIYNDKLQQKIAECADLGVSVREGCVLFDRTDVPNKLFDTTETYLRSEKKFDDRYGFVPAITQGNLDANILLKVDRDRECAEWLACRNSLRHIDESGKPIDLCYEYRACRDTVPGVACTDWVDPGSDSLGAEQLTEDAYVTRDTSWYGQEYTGLSLFEKFQIKDFSYITFDSRKEVQYLVYEIPSYFFDPPTDPNDIDYSGSGCFVNDIPKRDWLQCGFDSNGRCYEGQCIYPMEGAFPQDAALSQNDNEDELVRAEQDALQYLTGGSCKVFPQKDAPFPLKDSIILGEDVVQNADTPNSGQRRIFTEKNSLFSAANICQEGNCSCEYTKVSYGNSLVDYWPLTRPENSLSIPDGICQGGEKAGQPCSIDAHCDVVHEATGNNPRLVVPGQCSKKDKQETYVGQLGYCLEYDLSRPINGAETEFACLTWLPIDVSASNVDVYNLHPEAGYYPPIDASENAGGEVYCVDSNSHGAYTYDSQYTNANVLSSATNYVEDHPLDVWSNLLRQSNYVSDTQGIAQDKGIAYLYGAVQKYAWGRFGTDAVVFQVHDANEYEAWVNGNRQWYKRRWDGNAIVDDENQEQSGFHPSTELDFSGGAIYDLSTRVAVNLADIKKIDFLPVFVPPLKVASSNNESTANDVECAIYRNIAYSRWKNTGTGYTIQDIAIDFDAMAGEDNAVQSQTVDAQIVIANGDANPFLNFFSNEDWQPAALDLSGETALPLYTFKHTFDNGQTRFGYLLLWDYCYYHPYRGYSNVCSSAHVALVRNGQDIQRSFVQTLSATPVDQLDGMIDADFGYLAVMMDFDADGNYIDIYKKQRNPDNNSNNGCVQNEAVLDRIPSNGYFASVIELKPRCTDFVEVYDGNAGPSSGTNKAWTDRVWSGAVQSSSQLRMFQTDGIETVQRDMNLRPFGSTQLTGDDLDQYSRLREYLLDDSQNDGIPYACNASLINGKEEFKRHEQLFANAFMCSSLSADPVSSGGYGSYPGSDVELRQVVFDNVYDNSVSVLQQLFAKSYNRVQVGHEEFISLQAPDTASYDLAAGIGSATAPRIFSVNPYTCFSSRDADRCTVGQEHNITVNQRNGLLGYDYDGDGRDDEDVDRDGEVDDLVADVSYSVVVNFFAYADHNQMPIRRVLVDWQDGSRILDQKGFYKNRKPLCAPSETEPIGECAIAAEINFDSPVRELLGFSCAEDSDCEDLDNIPSCREFADQLEAESPNNSEFSCSENGPNPLTNYRVSCERPNSVPSFGDVPRACEQTYFTFTHSYTCHPGDADRTVRSLENESTQRRLLNRGLTLDDQVCVFTPRVQVLDNWGYCNGTDENGEPVSLYNDWNFPRCDSFEQETGNKSWTDYAGEIIVIPRDAVVEG